MIEKPKRETNKAYLDFIRGQPCCVCFMRPVEAHHIDTRGAGGSDLTAVPLCRRHHVEWHQLGKATSEDKWGLEWSQIIESLNKEFEDGPPGAT